MKLFKAAFERFKPDLEKKIDDIDMKYRAQLRDL